MLSAHGPTHPPSLLDGSWVGSWELATLFAAAVGGVYLALGLRILRRLRATHQTRNLLGWATAAIFMTCGIGHLMHVEHLLWAPMEERMLMRTIMADPHLWVLDGLAVVPAVAYIILRRRHHGPALFTDYEHSRQQALEINDAVVQGLAATHLALESHSVTDARQCLEATIRNAQRLVAQLSVDARPGDLRRHAPATVRH